MNSAPVWRFLSPTRELPSDPWHGVETRDVRARDPHNRSQESSARHEPQRLVVKLFPPPDHEQLGLPALDEHRLALSR
jgi:hypothetical protein